jgi:hypothetical protein
MFILIGLLSLVNSNLDDPFTCEKFKYQFSTGMVSITCEKNWEYITKGIYSQQCEDGVVVYITSFQKNSLRIYKETIDGKKIICESNLDK